MQLLKQEQNSAKLKVYFSVMNLYFHKAEEDFNASMSLLSIFHLELHENFKYYASVFDPFYKRRENEMIPLQGFFHFCKLMNLSRSAEEVVGMFTTLQEIDGVVMPVDDTLSIKNGLNYAQFLEAILRIGYLKAEANGGEAQTGAFKTALDNMFQGANIDISKRQLTDPVLIGVYSTENNKVFFEYNVLLSAIFTAKSYKGADSYIMISKQSFAEIIKEAGLLIMPKKKTDAEEKKEKRAREEAKASGKIADLPPTDPVFTEVELMNCISMVSSFDPDLLDYYNFLECILRVARARPWSKEDEQELSSFDLKLDSICGELENKYFNCIEDFEKKRVAYEKERKYQPRIVVDDDEEAGSDEEDL